MYKVYNTQLDISSNISHFIKNIFPDIRKTQLKFIPDVIFGMISSESSVASDIARKLKGQYSNVLLDSNIKRIKRLFTNKFFDPYPFYDKFISFVISNYKKKHSDKRVHIIIDHMFSHNNYTVLMFSMRIGKQGIPLWYRCFLDHAPSESMTESLIIEGISYVSKLFDNNFDLIFLADRWFNSSSLLKHIDSLGHTYCFRLKRNIKVLIYDKKEGHLVWKFLSDLKHYSNRSILYNDILLYDDQYKTNIVLSKYNDTTDPWIIVTNGDSKRAIKDYSYRFGGIESIFKKQKSNGFRIESTVNASLKYFTSMYTFVCISILLLTIIGAYYSKNSKVYKGVSFTTHKVINGVKRRVMSLFNTGLSLFNIAHNSYRYIHLPLNFILYDI